MLLAWLLSFNQYPVVYPAVFYEKSCFLLCSWILLAQTYLNTLNILVFLLFHCFRLDPFLVLFCWAYVITSTSSHHPPMPLLYKCSYEHTQHKHSNTLFLTTGSATVQIFTIVYVVWSVFTLHSLWLVKVCSWALLVFIVSTFWFISLSSCILTQCCCFLNCGHFQTSSYANKFPPPTFCFHQNRRQKKWPMTILFTAVVSAAL